MIAIAWTASFITLSAADGLLAWDLRFAYLPAAEAIRHGVSPYPGLHDQVLLDQKGYVYPPQLALLLVPLTFLPVAVAALLATTVSLACIAGTLRVLGVRDWRCYAAALLWMPSMSGLLHSNISLPLVFAVALAWRYRDRAWPVGASLGLAVSAKLFLWPMLVWTVATRRLRATVLAVAVGGGVTILAWSVIGFEGLTSYPALLRRLNEIQAENSYSLVGMSSSLGLGARVGDVLTFAVGGALLAGCVVLARRGDEERSFTCAVAATLALTPIVWLHYLVLLLVPTAIARPRFSWLWLLPIVLWISPRPGYPVGHETFAPAIVAAVVLGFLLVRPKEQRVEGNAGLVEV
jgi:alpha-1,2-mannosyltransferase